MIGLLLEGIIYPYHEYCSTVRCRRHAGEWRRHLRRRRPDTHVCEPALAAFGVRHLRAALRSIPAAPDAHGSDGAAAIVPSRVPRRGRLAARGRRVHIRWQCRTAIRVTGDGSGLPRWAGGVSVSDQHVVPQRHSVRPVSLSCVVCWNLP